PSDRLPISHARSETQRDRSVAPGLPRNVRIQAHQARIADEVQILRRGTDDLGSEERGAHPAQAIRIVNADPEDHSAGGNYCSKLKSHPSPRPFFSPSWRRLIDDVVRARR